uniref:Uncharacterized protein n=1 Tax=Timema genevievae TaxID=629358 RepID=A0A7R9K5S5_TIMGE|nr:unnamed protein product [Timema genevievae]
MSGARSNNNNNHPPDSLNPEREPVKFDVHLRGAPEEVVQLVQNIKDVAEQFLYHWKTFPLVLPPSLSSAGATGGDTGSAQHDGGVSMSSLPRRLNKHINLRDLFLAPSFDELDAVAVDGKGEPRRLNGKHLECIRERG